MSFRESLNRSGLQQQLRIVFFCMVLPLFVVFGIFVNVREAMLIRGAFEKETLRLARLAGYTLAPGVEFEDVKAVQEVINGLIQGGEVSYVIVTDRNQNVVASYQPENVGQKPFASFSGEHPAGAPATSTGVASTASVIDRGSVLHVQVPLQFNQRQLGEMAIGFSLDRINSEITTNIAIMIGALLVGLLFIYIGARYFGNLIITPLLEIKKAAEHLSRQEYDQVPAFVTAPQEIEYFYNTFVQMAEEIKRNHLALQNVNLTLEQKVAERTHELQIQTEKALQSDRLKSEFLANMSHELRTPLVSILAWPDIILEHYEMRDHVLTGAREIKKTGRHLLSLINDLLDLESIDTGKMRVHLQSTDPIPLIIEAIEHTSGFAGTRQVEVQAQFEADVPHVEIDPIRFKQVMINLLSNAIKFSPEKNRVIVRAGVVGDLVEFSVQDFGRGIAPEKQPIIFERFRQVDGTIRRKFGGSGIGLYLAKNFIDRMGGDIRVVSDVGKGSTFVVRLHQRTNSSIPDTNPDTDLQPEE
ncbi:MAG TPA: ATP-binding protein [Candidatus Ozemobacteraceae bacterium]|nr:ATP-binding protein [Candidatus Ozemobacteraceae bacterium]